MLAGLADYASSSGSEDEREDDAKATKTEVLAEVCTYVCMWGGNEMMDVYLRPFRVSRCGIDRTS